MNIREYIKALEAIAAEHGDDLIVETVNGNYDRVEAAAPRIAYRKILLGRQSKPKFFDKWDPETLMGEKVVRV